MTTAVKPKRTHMELTSGNYLDLDDPRYADVTQSDIALALSHTCRWAGHCPTFYSVAEHAVLVHDILAAWGAGRDLRAAGLHHDDHEAFVGDIATPVKNVLGDTYRFLCHALDVGVVAPLWGVSATDMHHSMVKEADTLALFVEAARFKKSKGLHWNGRPDVVELPESVYCAFGHSPIKAREEYLRRCRLY